MSDEIKNADDGEELSVEKIDKPAKSKGKTEKMSEKTGKKSEKKPVKQPDNLKKPRQGHVFKRMWAAIVRFFKNFKGEIKKIVWPKRQMVIKSTGVVLATIIVIGTGVWVVDYAISRGLRVIDNQASEYHSNQTTVSTTIASGDTTGTDTTASSGKTTTTTASSEKTTTTTATTAESTTASTTESTTAD